MNQLREGIRVIYQSTIRMEREQVIYFDPYGVKEHAQDADIIFITHDHYDHFSPEDLAKVRKADTKIIIAGDTDVTKENQMLKCDAAFLPIGGTYTMNAKEAAKLANIIHPQVVVPIHYGCIVGEPKDADVFEKMLEPGIACIKLMEFGE